MTYNAAFGVDKDTVRSASAVITYKKIVNYKEIEPNGLATITTDSAHNFEAGWTVDIEGVDSTFDGTYIIESTPESNTFTYRLTATDELEETAVTPNGTAIAPSKAYIRYSVNDAVIDAITSKTTFYAQAWDYNTVRIMWGLDNDAHKKILQDVSVGLTPLFAITRSGFGYPVSPIDGEKIFEKPYMDVVSSVGNTSVPYSFETQPESVDNDFKRPIGSSQSFYDRNLVSGNWYYYSLFFYVKGDAEEQKWVPAGRTNALVPINYKHFEKFYELIPPYYRLKDQEFNPSVEGGSEVLGRFLRVTGFEADYTRTLAEGVENSYNMDKVNNSLMYLVGETNLGINREDSLGDIRYRSLLAVINPLYAERGSALGLKNLTFAASKYKSKVLEGVNIMSLTDDSEFVFDTGSWGNIKGTTYPDTFTEIHLSDFNESKLTLVTDNDSPSTRKTAVSIEKVSGSDSNDLIVTCGVGKGNIVNRLHNLEETEFFPHLHGIRCTSGKIFTFSFYSKRVGVTAGDVSAGIMWFNLPKDHTFSWGDDSISEEHRVFASSSGADTTSMQRYYYQGQAPLSIRKEQFVYAVPYIRFSNSSTRHIASCMFSPELNSAELFPVLQKDITLTLGSSELLGSSALLGDQ